MVKATDKPGKVIAINYRDLNPEIAKQIFYRQRILSTLFPHNFPHYYASFVGKDGYGGTVRQEITTDSHNEVKYPFRKVREALEQIQLPIRIDTQDPKNFVVGIDGGEYYLDAPEEVFPNGWNQQKIF